MRINPFNAPSNGWYLSWPLPPFSPSAELTGLSTRRNTSLRPAISTCSLSKPASSHTRVMTLLSGLLLHHGRCFAADGGSFLPVTRSTSANDIGTRSLRWFFRNAPRASYFDMQRTNYLQIGTLTIVYISDRYLSRSSGRIRLTHPRAF